MQDRTICDVLVLQFKIDFEDFSFRHYLQHYSGTTRPTVIQLCLWIHWQVCCDKISSIAAYSYLSINGKLCFDQLPTASISTPPERYIFNKTTKIG